MKYILIGFLLRLLVAIWNGFFGPSLGADGDALLFHEIAVEVSRFGIFDTKYAIGWMYSMFLRVSVPSVVFSLILIVLLMPVNPDGPEIIGSISSTFLTEIFII